MGVCLMGEARRAAADIFQTFDLEYSGRNFGSTAVASGRITLDLSALPNHTTSAEVLPFTAPYVEAFSITVSGSRLGNGTFTQADHGSFDWNTNGGTLDFTKQLVDQPTNNTPWGIPGDIFKSGDFSLFSNSTNPAAPEASDFFELATNGRTSVYDLMGLTSFAPVPEPSSVVLFILGAAGLFAAARRRS
jgi:hypothetical protein